MGSVEKSPLLSPLDVDETIKDEQLEEENNSPAQNKLRFIVGLFGALGWVTCAAFSAIFVQVRPWSVVL